MSVQIPPPALTSPSRISAHKPLFVVTQRLLCRALSWACHLLRPSGSPRKQMATWIMLIFPSRSSPEHRGPELWTLTLKRDGNSTPTSYLLNLHSGRRSKEQQVCPGAQTNKAGLYGLLLGTERFPLRGTQSQRKAAGPSFSSTSGGEGCYLHKMMFAIWHNQLA